ncbi:MAG: WG repeat-containing protein, partial [Azoarcus sp.]|nr:WG repeat-containing protein [Azoarcus sp.]
MQTLNHATRRATDTFLRLALPLGLLTTSALPMLANAGNGPVKSGAVQPGPFSPDATMKKRLSALAIALCALLLSSCQKTADASQPALSEEQTYQNILLYGFEPVAMTSATPAQIESARLWRSVAPSVSADGTNDGQLLSLNPANEDLLPVIWHVTTNKAIALKPPPADLGYDAQEIRVAELGAFSGGLAPVRIEIFNGTNANSQKRGPSSHWGYVDSAGNWLAAGFGYATPFNGDVAVVSLGDGWDRLLKLLNREGKFLDGVPITRGPGGFYPILPQSVGRWTWVKWSGENPSSRTRIYLNLLTDGTTLHTIPEDNNGGTPTPSPDGQLWIQGTEKGPALWSLERGFISLPDDLTPQFPLSATTFLAPSHKTQGHAIYDLDGNVLADPAPIVSNAPPLAENRFIACEGNYRDDVYKWIGAVSQAPYSPRDYHCGIMDARGQWWASPRYHLISAQSNRQVLLQTGGKACLADLSQATGPADCDQTGSQLPVPVLRSKTLPPEYLQYGYLDASGKLPLDYRYDQAAPFTGSVARVSQEMPGLIDATGKWLTPRPSGPLSDVALVHAWTLRSQKLATQTGYYGLIDRQGHWVIPPMYASLFRYPDGSLCAKLPSRIYAFYTRCIHMDLTGKELPALSDQEIEQFRTVQAMPPAQRTPEIPLSVSDIRPALEAVSVNGRWGFQNAEGQWIIRPKFDDAADFSEGLGRVALR